MKTTIAVLETRVAAFEALVQSLERRIIKLEVRSKAAALHYYRSTDQSALSLSEQRAKNIAESEARRAALRAKQKQIVVQS